MTLAPIVQITLVISLASLVIATLWVYFRPEVDPMATPPEEDPDDALIARTREEREARQAAQERLFAELDRVRGARKTRQALNDRPYDTTKLPQAALTLVTMTRVEDDRYAAFVMLLPEQALSATLADFESYWSQAETAFWSWQGDNLLEGVSERDLKRVVNERFAAMREALRTAGWREASTHQPDEQSILIRWKND